MRQSLVYGTATTLLLAVATLPAYAGEAYAEGVNTSSGFGATDMLYGVPALSPSPPSVSEEILQESSWVAMGAAGIVGGVTMVAAGVELARHWRQGDPDAGNTIGYQGRPEPSDGDDAGDAWSEVG